MLDMPTIIVATCCTAIVQGLLLVWFWLRDSRSPALAISGAAFICFGVGFAVMGGRELFPVNMTIWLGGASIMLSGVLFVNATRQFGRRNPYSLLALATPALWIAGYAYWPVMETAANRATMLSIFMACCFFLCAFECWRWKSGRIASRKLLIGAALAFGALFVLRAIFNADLPFPLGSRPRSADVWFSMVSFTVFILLSMVAFLAVGMTHHGGETEREMQAVIDPLTGTLRRGAFMLQGARVVARHHDDGRSACVALVRLEVPEGRVDNDVLQRFSRCASGSLKAVDLIARSGGDEFVLLMSDVVIGDAVDMLNDIVAAFDTDLQFDGRTVLARAGIVSSTQTGADLRRMVQAADQALNSRRFAGEQIVPYNPAVTPVRRSQRAIGVTASL